MTLEPPPIRVPGPAAPPLRCGDCGERIPSDARFCPSCGAAYGIAAARHDGTRVSVGVGSGFRFGLGFFVAAALFGVISFLVSILVAGTLVGALVAGFTGVASTGASTFQGAGDARSQPLRLSGDVEIAWTASDPDGGGCQIDAVAVRAGREIAREALLDLAVATQEAGTYVLRGLIEADYVIQVDSDCAWTFRVAR